jgi:pantoate--beta-alanine ligase
MSTPTPTTSTRQRTRTPVVARSRGELAKALASLRGGADGTRRSIALVPTMGALHEGHRSLIRTAGELADAVVVSIFVNPLQFGAGEDLDRYPRTEADDLKVCGAEGVAVVFAPTPDVVYPTQPQVTVHAGPLGELYEGASRPGHFDGVLTVVAKLFNLVAPDLAVFGEKDYQQLALIRQMVHDLDVPVHVVGAPTVRERDGLALSSRNRYLSDEQRSGALVLSRALLAGAMQSDAASALSAAQAVVETEPGIRVDYLALVDAVTLQPVADSFTGAARMLVAAYAGTTRLIDNIAVTSAPPRAEGKDDNSRVPHHAEVEDPPRDGDPGRPALRRLRDP